MKKRISIIISSALVITFCVCIAFSNADETPLRQGGIAIPLASNISVGSDSDYDLFVDENSLALSICDKLTGEEVWVSGNIPSDVEDDEGNLIFDNGLTASWEAMARSAVTVIYGKGTQLSYTRAVSKSAKITALSNGFKAEISINDIKLKFNMLVTLNGNELKISIPFKSIVEGDAEKNPLMSIALYPYFNVTRGLQRGEDSYIFVPDGSGALIDTSKSAAVSGSGSQYAAKVYGDDLGIAGLDSVKSITNGKPPERITLPSFGMASGGKGFVAYIAGGAEYSEIKASMTGIVSDYNYVYNTFHYREMYNKKLNNRGATDRTLQSGCNEFDACAVYLLLKDGKANYSGMAGALRQYLTANGLLRPTGSFSGDIPLKADFLMAESRSEVIGSSVVKMSDTAFVENAFKSLQEKGVERIYSSLSGYSKGGLTGAAPSFFGFEPATGGTNGYKKLISYAKDADIKLAFAADYVKVKNGNGSYSMGDIAMSEGKQKIMMPDYKKYDFTYEDDYFLHAAATSSYYKKDRKNFNKYNIENIQLDSIGGTLASSHSNSVNSRSQAIETYRSVVKQAGSVIVENPNSYLWNIVQTATDVPTYNSGFLLAPESIPFVQMVTGGHIESFRNHINLNYHGSFDVLNMIEYNVYPSYILTEADSLGLYRTDSFYIFSSRFAAWEGRIAQTYKQVNEALRSVRGAEFIYHEQIAANVFKCGYSNGAVIYVNYGVADFTDGDLTVPAGGYEVRA